MEKVKRFPGDQWISEAGARILLQRMSRVDDETGRVCLVGTAYRPSTAVVERCLLCS